MSSQLELFDQLKAENEIIKIELNNLKTEKENMIHLMVRQVIETNFARINCDQKIFTKRYEGCY